jgi:Fe-S oxidoreductase
MGWLPVWSRLAMAAPKAVNALTHTPGLDRIIKSAGGVAQERSVPEFAPMRFATWFRRLDSRGDLPRGDGSRGEVLLWPDTFTNHFSPWIGVAAVQVLEAAGFTVRIPDGELCCGLTWISTGQLSVATKVLRRTARALAPQVSAGIPVVGLEPSCTAVFRSDARDLLGEDRDVQRLQAQTRTLAELLLEKAGDWQLPHVERQAVVQMHCHQHAVLDGGHADAEILERAGVQADVLDSGCCGLAGDFGFEAGHYDVSMACAEDGLLPAIREASPGTLVVADGFSCRTQVEQSGALDGGTTQGQGAGGRASEDGRAGGRRRPVHLAQVLAAGLPPTPSSGDHAIPADHANRAH